MQVCQRLAVLCCLHVCCDTVTTFHYRRDSHRDKMDSFPTVLVNTCTYKLKLYSYFMQ